MKLGFLHSFIVRRWLGVNSITRATFAFVCIFSALLFSVICIQQIFDVHFLAAR